MKKMMCLRLLEVLQVGSLSTTPTATPTSTRSSTVTGHWSTNAIIPIHFTITSITYLTSIQQGWESSEKTRISEENEFLCRASEQTSEGTKFFEIFFFWILLPKFLLSLILDCGISNLQSFILQSSLLFLK